jgi:aryl-alcohol dehydrogenase-like predicted oxidoreductase
MTDAPDPSEPTEPTSVPRASDRIALAGSEVSIPPLGVGTWAWGDESTWGMGGYDTDLTRDSIQEAWNGCLDAGVTFFDTAEVYGKGESERIIGGLLADEPRRADVVIATKFMPFPWKVNVRSALLASARASLDRLGIDAADLYQIHGPISLRGHGALADALVAAHEQGLVKAVGVSNYSVREVAAFDDALRKRGLRLATNQIEYSLLRRVPETSGLIQACADRGVVPLAYSPIGQGRLTGKYSAANPPPGKRNFSDHPMERVDQVVAVLRRIGEAHDGRTPSQVALNWLIAKGAVPIPGAKNREQAEQNAGALGWAITADEQAELDSTALESAGGFGQRFWQHG